MVDSSETCEGASEWETLGRSIEDFIESFQSAGHVRTSQTSVKLPWDMVLHNLKLLELRIVNRKLTTPLCQKITALIFNFLTTVKPEGELEEACTMVLLALGSYCPGIAIIKLWDQMHQNTLPPRSLLLAVGELSLSQGTATYIGATWEYILRLLRKAQKEEDRLAICLVLRGLATNARKCLDLGSKDEEKMDIPPELVSIKAYQTLRIFYNRWPLKSKSKVTEQVLVIIGHLFFLMPPPKLKNQVNWLIRWLMTLMAEKLNSFYISQCICQLLDALTISGCGGVNLASQLENIANMLFKQVSEKVNSSDTQSVQNHNFALRSFYLLTKLYNDQVVLLLRKTLESNDTNEIVSALEVFKDVFQEVPQTAKLKGEVMNSVILVIQDDLKPVRMALLNFLEKLGKYDYLTLPQGNVIINYIIKLSESNSSVSLPKLINLVCQPSNTLAFVVLTKTATEMALKARALGQAPYLSNFHLRPNEFVSPQKLLTHLVLFSLKPYREKEFGESSLRLLSALHPITSLHPIIHSNVGVLWMKMIPQMLKFLNDHTEKNLNPKDWENTLLNFSSQSLLAINDDSWLEQLTQVILENISFYNEDDEEKAFLYKFFGFTLRTSRNQNLVKRMLSSILKTAHEELLEREGIAMAFSIVSLKHLKIALDELKEYSTILTNKDTSSILKLMKEHQQGEWGLVCNTIYLSYSKIILETKEAISVHLEAMLALVLQHYQDCIVEKDKNLKLDYLNSLANLTDILSSLSITCQLHCPHKQKMVAFMMELIKEEPMNSISSCLRQKAMNIITNFSQLTPLLEPEERAELLRTCYKSVLCLPPAEVLQREASSPKDAQTNVELLKETLQSLRILMEALIIEMPTRVQNCLEYLDTWLNSQKDHERERAMWCTARILGFTVKMNNFHKEIEFTRLGRLVRLLAIRCQDPVDNICFLSSQAVYNLYCILLLQKKMGRKKQGLWEEEGKSEVYSANVFYNNTFEIAKAFAEYFTQIQVSTLVLTAMEGLTDSRAKVSLAAAQLMSAVMKERGRDMIKIEEVVEGILERLNSQLEPSTKEETLQAMCSLAGNNSEIVVPMLLNRPLPWNRTNLALWRAFGTQRETTLKVLQLLIGILEKYHPTLESQEMASQPVAAQSILLPPFHCVLSQVTCALCEMLSGSLCQEAVQELYPRLLISVLCHLYWVTEQNAPQKMVVYSKEGVPGSKSKPFDPTSCALEAVKLVILAAEYNKVVSYANEHRCWDLLSCPKFYYIGIMELTSNPWPPISHPSGIVKNCEPYILHRILNHVRNLLYSLDDHQKILARTFYAQLLWHRSVAQTLGQDFLGNLIKWIKEPNLIMNEVGLRGISNLALHPGQSEILKSLVPLLQVFLKDEVRVTVQAVKSLRNIICHGQGQDIKVVFCGISKQLRPLINDERDQVRISATSALGHMLRRIDKFKPGPSVRREIYTFLVPLLLSIQDNNTEVVKACGGALTEWTNVIGWSSLTQTFRHTTLSDHIQVLEETCKHLVSTSRTQLVGELLFQSFGFLKSPQPFVRAASVTFIGLTAKRLSLSQIHEDDVDILQKVLESLRNDPVEQIQSLVNTVLKKIEAYIHPESSHSSRLSRLSSNFLKFSGIKTSAGKKRLFKIGKLEEVDDYKEKKPRNCLQFHVNSLSTWHQGKVKNTPLVLGNLPERPASSQPSRTENI
ncbi:maestro heat-like repeat-containing protein family member 1 isoform X4 [Tamandua tetradactyla]|uniref:maestro heat-like repeat-containing protein family member 1 isoform X4 n=1 Tax=Tamandua tetradactyla TaxID=48850 RepID=UPI004053E4DC